MRTDTLTTQEESLVERLRSLEVEGVVIEKRTMEASGGEPGRNIVVVRSGESTFETDLDDPRYERIKIGDRIRCTPPVPDHDPCCGHLFACLVIGLLLGGLAVYAITSHFQGRTAILLSLISAGWIAIIVWARTCCHERNRNVRVLREELTALCQSPGRCQKPPSQAHP